MALDGQPGYHQGFRGQLTPVAVEVWTSKLDQLEPIVVRCNLIVALIHPMRMISFANLTFVFFVASVVLMVQSRAFTHTHSIELIS